MHSMPSGVHVVSDPDGTLGFEHCMEEVLYSVYDMALTLLLCHTRYSSIQLNPLQCYHECMIAAKQVKLARSNLAEVN